MKFTSVEAIVVKRQIRTHGNDVWGGLDSRQRDILLAMALGEKSSELEFCPEGYGPCPTHGAKCTVLVNNEEEN